MACQHVHNCLLTVVMARPRYELIESTSSLGAGLRSVIVVLRKVHAVWKFAQSYNVHVCAGFHIMYIHEMCTKKISIPCIICMCSFLKGEAEGLERNN